MRHRARNRHPPICSMLKLSAPPNTISNTTPRISHVCCVGSFMDHSIPLYRLILRCERG